MPETIDPELDLPDEKQIQAPPSWEDVSGDFGKAYPSLDKEALRTEYEKARQLSIARSRLTSTSEEPGDYLKRRAIPLISAARNVGVQLDYTASQKAIQSGTATDHDYATVAEYEHQQEIDRNRSTGGKILSAVAHVPAVAGEFGVGSVVARGAAGLIPRAAAYLAPPATEATVAFPRLAPLSRLATQTVTVPSMYAERWTQKNMENGRDPLDPRGLPPAFGLAMMQIAVLGAVGRSAGQVPGTGPAVWGQRIAAGTITGMKGQALVDIVASAVSEVLPRAYKLETGYGILGDAINPQKTWGDVWEHVAVQAATFAAFSALHAHKGPNALEATAEASQALAKQGLSREAAGGKLAQVQEILNQHLQKNPNLTRAEARQAVEDNVPDGPLKEFGLKWADSLPGKPGAEAPQQEAQGPHPGLEGPPEQSGPPAPEPGTGLINPVQTGVPGVVSGAREIPEPVRPQEPPAATEVATEAYQKYLKAQRTLDEAKKAEARELASGVVSGNGRRARIRASKDLNQARYEWEQAGASAAAGRPAPEAEEAKPTTPQEIVKPAETPEEAALRHQLTHSKKWPDVGNTALFEEGEKPGAVAVTDVDGLGKLGKEQGDAVVRGKINALRAAGLEPYHAGQDEFYVKGSSPAELEAKLEDARARLKASHNADFSYGIGRDRSTVDGPLREMKAAKKEAKPEPTSEFPKSKPEAEADMDALARKASLGEGVHINDVFKAAGLTAREQHVVLERMLERTHEDIGADEPMLKKDGTAVSRQRVKQIEQSALKKLGLQPDFALSELNDSARAGRVADKIAAGQTLDPKDIGVDPAELAHAKHRALTVEEKAEKEMDRLLKALEKEEKDNGGRLTEDRKRFYFSELERLHREAQGLPPTEGGAAEGGEDAGRGPVEPAPVRPESGTGLPGGDEAPGTPDAQQGAPAPAPENTPPETAAGGRGEAAGNELTYEQQAKALGAGPQTLHELADFIGRHDQSHVDEWNDMLRESRRMLDEYGGHAKLIHLDRYGDADSVPGLDEVADYWSRGRYPPFGDGDVLFQALKAGNKKPLSRDDVYREAIDQLSRPQSTWQPDLFGGPAKSVATQKGLFSPEQEANDARQKAVQAGFSSEAIEEVVQRGQDAAQVEIDSESAAGRGEAFEPERPAAAEPEPWDEPTAGRSASELTTPRPVVDPTAPRTILEKAKDFLEDQRGSLDLQRIGQIVKDFFTPDTNPRTGRPDSLGEALKEIFAPATRGEQAKLGAGILRHNLAILAQKRVHAEKALDAADAHFDKWIVAEKDPVVRTQKFLSFTDAIETGKIDTLPKELQEMARTIRDLNDGREKDVVDRDLIKSTIENYLGHLWKKPGSTMAPEEIGRMLAARRPLAGSEAYRKARSLPTYRDGIEAGLEPADWNPVRLVLQKLQQVDKSVMAHDVIGELKDNSLWWYRPFDKGAPEGWMKISDKAANVFVPEGKKGLLLKGSYYTPEPVGRLLENYLQPGLTGNKIYDLTRGFGNTLNQMQLGFSAFHGVFVAGDTVISSVARGLQQISRGDILPGLRSIGTAPLTPWRNFVEGSKMLKEYDKPGSQGAEMAALLNSFREGGGRAKMDSFYKNNSIEAFRQALRQVQGGDTGKVPTVLRKALPALAEFVSKPIMEIWVPRLKMGVFADMARYELERLGPSADLAARREALGKAWDSVENRMGQLTYDNLFLNRTVKDLLMVGVRSVGWNIGTARELGGGLADLPSAVIGARSGQGIGPRTAYTVALPMVAGLFGAIYQYLATGKGPEETKDYFFPKTGRTRKDGSADRVALPSYMRDVAHVLNRSDEGPGRVAQNAWDMAKGKINPGLSLGIQMLENKDFSGAAIANPTDTRTQQAWDYAKHVIGSYESISSRTMRQQQKQGATVGQSVQGFLGVTPAPSRITHTWEEQRQKETGRKRELTPQQKRLIGLKP